MVGAADRGSARPIYNKRDAKTSMNVQGIIHVVKSVCGVGVTFLAAAALFNAGPVMAQDVASSIGKAPALFGQSCAVCHGGDAEGTDRAPALLNNRQLRATSDADIGTVIKNGRGNMPAFSFLPADQIQSLAHFVRSLNADAFDIKPAGDIAAGAGVFFGGGHCAECHTAQGRGGTNGPDLSSIGRQVTLSELTQALNHPGNRIPAGYESVEVELRDGSSLRGLARSQSSHSLALQTADGRMHLLSEDEYDKIVRIKSAATTFHGTDEERTNLIAFLSGLNGVAEGPAPTAPSLATAAEKAQIDRPALGDWPTYSGNVSGNRHSPLDAINVQNVSQLRPEWIHALPYNGLETTPLVIDGVMYVSGPNQVYALDGRTGSQLWAYSRPRSTAAEISGDAAKGASRGVAVLGERVFFITDNAHLICLHRLTGALLWDILMPEQPGRYGGTSAPLIVGDLVIGGVSGGDEDIRGFVAAYHAATGERAWRFWTVPKAGERDSETWKGDADPRGGASWSTGSYDPRSGTLFVGIGNPYPDTDGDNRGGDNLYTDSDLALDAKTGKLLWHFQFTPHDLHDWDANQPLVLLDTRFQGMERKLLLHANRNGFFYVLDRSNGRLLRASALVKKLTWASGIGADGRPILLPNNETTPAGVETCPAVRGATNWYSTAYNPTTRLYYVMTVEDCSLYRKAHDGGYGRVNHPNDPPIKVLRAIEIDSGKIAWELPMQGNPERNYSGVLSTAGGVVFFGETSGGFAAVDAANGRQLWHFETNQPWKASPMTYAVKGRQYVAIASGADILSFALPVTKNP
jgi:PQQ-dependent dehydrogenase (methanol/ethanol family)